MLDQLAIYESQRSFAYLKPEYSLKPGQDLPKPEAVFPRLVVDEERKAS